MDNPLLLKRPDNLVEQIRAYARDIAYLVVQGECKPTVTSTDNFTWGATIPAYTRQENMPPTLNVSLFQNKWGAGRDHQAPSLDLLSTFGYLIMVVETHRTNWLGDSMPPLDIRFYTVSEKAFTLLEKPYQPPQVFISYRRIESSAFALLVEARLRIAGIDNIFIDKDIAAGDDWHEELEEKIEHCQYFICLIGPTTLNSHVVNKEIKYAEKSGCRIIAIWHNEHKVDNNCPLPLRTKNAIQVTGQSAREYETAISQLLNDMDYRTY